LTGGGVTLLDRRDERKGAWLERIWTLVGRRSFCCWGPAPTPVGDCIGDIFGDPERDDGLGSTLTDAIGTRPMLEVRLPGVMSTGPFVVIPWTRGAEPSACCAWTS